MAAALAPATGDEERGALRAFCFSDFGPAPRTWRDSFAQAGGPFAGALCLGSGSSYLVFRAALFLLWGAITLWSLADHLVEFGIEYVGFWLIYLTRVSAIAELAFLGLAAWTTWTARRAAVAADDPAPWHAKAAWCLGTIAPTVATVVFLLYWVLVYEPGNPVHAISVCTHGVNFLVILMDFMTSRLPIRIRHVYAVILSALGYCIFSGFYYLVGGENEDGDRYIYSSFDFSKPGAALRLSALTSFVAVPFLYAMFLLLSVFRNKCLQAIAGVGSGGEGAVEVGASTSAKVSPVPDDIVGEKGQKDDEAPSGSEGGKAKGAPSGSGARGSEALVRWCCFGSGNRPSLDSE